MVYTLQELDGQLYQPLSPKRLTPCNHCIIPNYWEYTVSTNTGVYGLRVFKSSSVDGPIDGPIDRVLRCLN
eukprot:1194756-Prorocentrum_minimum.AAC.8